MRINQSGFAHAALGFVVFAVLMGIIVISRNTTSEPSVATNPELSQESSPVAQFSANPKAITSTPKASASSSPTASAKVSSDSNSPVPSTQNTIQTTTQSPTPAPTGRYITITAPSGGEMYKVGSLLNITWEYNDLKQCVIKYITEGGQESSLFISAKPEQKSKQIAILENYLGPLDSVKIKIKIDCYSSDNNYAGDESGYITITK